MNNLVRHENWRPLIPFSHIRKFPWNFCHCAIIRKRYFPGHINPSSAVWIIIGEVGIVSGNSHWGWEVARAGVQQQGTDAKYVSIYFFYSINPIQLTLFFRQFSTNFISAGKKIRCLDYGVYVHRTPGCEKETNDFLDVCVVWHLLANKNTNLDRLFLKKSHKISKCYMLWYCKRENIDSSQ